MKSEPIHTPSSPPAFDPATAIPVPTRREPASARTVAYAQPATKGWHLFGVQQTWIITVTDAFASEYFPAPPACPVPSSV